MKAEAILSYALLVAGAAGYPSTSLLERDQTWCGSYNSLSTPPYTLYHNNWGAGSASSGQQCTTFHSNQANSVSWSTSWTWQGGYGSVKSYSNVALEHVNKKLSAVHSIPSQWSWSYQGNDIVADVAYDLWLAPSASSSNTYEIMVWLAAYGGAFPITQTGRPVGSPTIQGTTWKLYKGYNGDTTVFSFVAPYTINNFNGDLKSFFDYLVSSQGVSADNVITSLQGGTEPFSGSNAVFKTDSFSISAY